jgi:hypothetical protein
LLRGMGKGPGSSGALVLFTRMKHSRVECPHHAEGAVSTRLECPPERGYGSAQVLPLWVEPHHDAHVWSEAQRPCGVRALSPVIQPRSLHRLDRQWAKRGTGVLVLLRG